MSLENGQIQDVIRREQCDYGMSKKLHLAKTIVYNYWSMS